MSRTEAIVLLVPGFPGSEEETECLPPVQNFVKAVARRNPDVAIHVISFQYPFKPGDYRWHGATVHALAGANKRIPWRLITWLKALMSVFTLFRTHQVLAVHSMWLGECAYLGSWLAKWGGVRHIATIRGQDALPANRYLKRLPFECTVVTAGSEKAAEAFFASTGRRADHVIPTGIDAEAIAECGTPSARTIDILGVGSLIPIKNFACFIEVIAAVRAEHPNLRIVILGEGPERPDLENRIRNHRMDDLVHLEGRVRREQVLQTMRKSKILLHTSRYEGQGYVFLEALASGMRIVCFDVGYTGIGKDAYRCKSSEEMAEILKRLLASPDPNHRVEVMSIEDTAAAFEKIYRGTT